MTTWATADWHLGHENILTYCAATRPFTDLVHMREILIANFNDAVGPGDLTYFLGDVAMGDRSLSLRSYERLNGRKVLVAGNHDHCWVGHKKRDPWAPRYLEVFDEVHDGADPLKETVASTPVLMHHFPWRGSGDHSAEERYSEHRLADTGGWLLHGHTHGLWKVRGRMIDVGVDAWECRPVSWEQLAAIIEAPTQHDTRS